MYTAVVKRVNPQPDGLENLWEKSQDEDTRVDVLDEFTCTVNHFVEALAESQTLLPSPV